MRSSCVLVITLLGMLAAVVSTKGPDGPCDIYQTAGTPCVAAHSMVRAMYVSPAQLLSLSLPNHPRVGRYAAYTGPLYTLQRSSDNATKDIGSKPGTGFADAATQVAFCSLLTPTTCTVERIFDQSGHENHLERVAVFRNNTHGWPTAGINAMRDGLSVGGHAVYSAYFEGGQGTRLGTIGFRSNRLNGNASGVAVGEEPETVCLSA